MKTNLYAIILALVFVTVVSSCDDKLNIQPAQSVDASLALKTSKDVKGTLIGAYSSLGSANLYGGAFTVDADLLASASDINFFGTFQGLTQIANKAIPITNTFVSGMWLDAYSTINTTNIILANLNLVDTVDQKTVEGEAKFIRGLVYFNLVQFFSKTWHDGDATTNLGVPIVLNPITTLKDAEVTPARNTVAEVYGQIISDLKDAKSLLPTAPSPTYYFATTGAASAILSRVYLTQLDYTNAAIEANTVIASGVYSLTNTYKDEFPYTGAGVRIFNTSEDIFAQQVSEQNGINGNNTFYASADLGGRGDIEMSSDYLSTYEEGDDRAITDDDLDPELVKKKMFSDDGSGDYFYTDKWDNQFGNIKIIRLAEMYLTRAECNLRMSAQIGNTAPLDDINLIRERVNLEDLDAVNVDDVLKERHLELAFEGVWMMDYKRTETSILLVPPIAWNSSSLVFPIPQREIIVNPSLTQNAGY